MAITCSNNRGRVIDCELPYTSGVMRALGIAVDELLQPVYHHGRLLDNVGRNCVDGPWAELETQLELVSAHLESSPIA